MACRMLNIWHAIFISSHDYKLTANENENKASKIYNKNQPKYPTFSCGLLDNPQHIVVDKNV